MGVKNKPRIDLVIYLLLLIVGLIALFSPNQGNSEPDVIDQSVEQSTKPLQEKIDFLSSKEGTFLGIIQQDPLPSVEEATEIVFFRSVKVPRLTITYHPAEQKLTAGTPVMIAQDIVLFDGVPHRIGYSFRENDKQILFVDGEIVAQSDFKLQQNYLTGLVTGVEEIYISDILEKVEIE